jgi:hypothetical protein
MYHEQQSHNQGGYQMTRADIESLRHDISAALDGLADAARVDTDPGGDLWRAKFAEVWRQIDKYAAALAGAAQPREDECCRWGCSTCHPDPGPWHADGCPSWRAESSRATQPPASGSVWNKAAQAEFAELEGGAAQPQVGKRCDCCGHPLHDGRALCAHPEPLWHEGMCHCAGSSRPAQPQAEGAPGDEDYTNRMLDEACEIGRREGLKEAARMAHTWASGDVLALARHIRALAAAPRPETPPKEGP